MDYTYEDILARMRRGDTADNIADELAKMLNKAQTQIAEEEKRSKKQQEFDKACAEAAEAMNYALDTYGALTGKNTSNAVYTADSVASIVKMATGFSDIVTKMKRDVETYDDDDFDAIVNKFLRANNIE